MSIGPGDTEHRYRGTAGRVARGVGSDQTRTFPADTVVIATYHEPNAELADHLRAAGLTVHTAGNVNGSDTIQAAIHTAAAIARNL